MSDKLRQVVFSREHVEAVAGLECGEEAWCKAQSQWITTDAVFESMSARETSVWLFFNEANELVGYGALGGTRRPHPPGTSGYKNLSVIPSLAVKRQFWGRPKDGIQYSHQILASLILEAKKRSPTMLILDVDSLNTHAIALYCEFGFEDVGPARMNGQRRMSVNL